MKFVFFGAPGAGKGTMAAKAAAAFGFPHISTGEIFRGAMRDGTPLGLKVKAIIESGGLVSDELTIGLVRERLAMPDAAKGWLLDGFPRTIAQAEALASFCPEDYVIDLEVTDAKVVERLSGRRMCRSCGRSFHTRFMPPSKPGLCDDCGGELYVRDDDREESVRVRLENYRAQTAPLVGLYKARGTLVPVDGESSADAVWSVLHVVMNRLIAAEKA
ncbi:MAG: adenylate kinase [Spirochaetae bacterium HGW-Spirochaetae-3]|jgi:adenylate kinase|nr:MAG: adenylate kinase [Spirochaetae bacterium HGW-Spirochaetae-3]